MKNLEVNKTVKFALLIEYDGNNLIGWQTLDIYQNLSITYLNSIIKNQNINLLLDSINEDKHTNPTTTSNKFKSDVWEFFQGYDDKICVEFGTHKGQTTKVLSYCFKHVYTININLESFAAAKMLNVGIENITYVPFNLYSDRDLNVEKSNVFMIDAGHKYPEVIHDINRCIKMSADGDCYIIFDDYGLNTHEENVKRAVDDVIKQNKIEISCLLNFVFLKR